MCLLGEESKKTVFAPLPDGTYPLLWGHALNTGEPFFTNLPEDHLSFSGLPEGHIPIKCFLSVPVKYTDKLVGQIALANPEKNYSDHDLMVVSRLAALYALAINRYRNIEERQQLMNNLRQAQKMEAIGTLAGGIAHDFNNLLVPILGYIELTMMQFPASDKNRKNLEKAYIAATHSKELVQQILTFSRGEKQDRKRQQLQPIISETMKLLQATLPSTIQIRQKIDENCGLMSVDTTQVTQVLINLFTNAYHAMEDGKGTISIQLLEVDSPTDQDFGGTFPAGKRVAKLSVADTGVGMTPKEVARIFEPYFTTKEKTKGTGLGLAVVHGIIKSYGGAIQVDSKPGKGTTFHLYLPIAQGEEEPSEIVSDETFCRGSEHILVVDDEEIVAEIVQEILKTLGYKVTSCNSGAAALELFEKQMGEFSLVITDQTMPGMMGTELSERIHTLNPDTPIIICSGYSGLESEMRSNATGVRRYLMKPVKMKELAGVVRKILDQKG